MGVAADVLIEERAAAKAQKPRIVRWVAITAAAVLCAIAIGLIVVVHVWPFKKQAVVDALQARSARVVEIGSFRETWFPPGFVAENVTFLRHKHPDQTPVLIIRKLVVRANYTDLLVLRHRIDNVVASGMRVMIPPKQPNGKPRPIPLTEGNSKTSMQIGRIVADDTVLDFMPAEKGKQPYRLKVQRLTLTDVGAGAPMHFTTTLINPKPPAVVEASGQFGPWNPGDPSHTPVSGSFRLEHANLGVSRLVSGILNASGRFHGTLEKIEANGSTDIPVFHVSGSGNTEHLWTSFSAMVNGTTGDTLLHSVRAHVGRTSGLIEGSIAGEHGKSITLDMGVINGRVADLMRIFIAAKTAPMDGAISLKGKVTIPPGTEDFVRKLVVVGDFGVGGGRFTDPATQTPISRLSDSAQGESTKEIRENPGIVLSNLKGHVAVRNGVATFTGLTFSVPGALARMKGTFNLVSDQVDLTGVLETTGNLSDTTTGFKALIVKVITPFFKKKNQVRFVPFRISGHFGQTHVSLAGKPSA